ncbi:MAG: protein kinase [Verrucomicrobiaceae bacterium]|nr:protein kinase [Verrucomicrobiaceae bacterium]
MSESSPTCPRCGDPRPATHQQLCPRCLMAEAMQPTQGGDDLVSQSALSPEELAPHFPQLEILECLGRGGMGVVYKAKQKSLNRFVALKILAPERADDPQFAARFEKEAQALAALNHPNIVAVYDFGRIASGSADSQPSALGAPLYFLLMEFVDGVNLRQLLQTKKLTPKEALSIVPPICDALQCAHDYGIVHRDIKPENLLIDKVGIVKIADFGIAKMVERTSKFVVSDDAVTNSEVRFTSPLGTPAYAAPEQANGIADHRADIYSLGVVLYEMLTGERPKDAITPPSKRVQVDIRIDEIVLRALEKTPELRWQTASEVKTQLATIQEESPVAPDMEPSTGWKAAVIALTSMLLLRVSPYVAMYVNGGRGSWNTDWSNILMSCLYVFFWVGTTAYVWRLLINERKDRPFNVGPRYVLCVVAVATMRLPLGLLGSWVVAMASTNQNPSHLQSIGMWSGGLASVSWAAELVAMLCLAAWSQRRLHQQPARRYLLASIGSAVAGTALPFLPMLWLWWTNTAASPARQNLSTQSVITTLDPRLPVMASVQKKLAAFHQGQPDNRAVVKVVYFHAADREPLPNYVDRVERSLSNVSDFYREDLGHLGVKSQGIPFERDERGKIKLRVVRGAQPSDHYKHESGDETWAEVQSALKGIINADKDHVLILYGLCDTARDGRYIFHAPYYGAGGSNHQSGLCHAADCELLDPRNLTSTKRMVFSEHYYPRKEMTVGEFNTWYLGGLAHELGHALGLPHDNGSPQEEKLGVSLMGMGNLNYREHLRGGKRPAYLSLASAIRLTAKPFMTRSDKARWEPVKLGAYVIEAWQGGYDLMLKGRVSANVPACAVIATIWSAVGDSTDHHARTFCSIIDDKGGFALRVATPGPVACHLKLSVVLANGAEPSVSTLLSIDPQGRMKTDELTLDLHAGMVEMMLASDPEQAKPMLTDEAIAQVGSEEARRRLKMLQGMTLPEPEPVNLDTTNDTRVVLSDAQWTKAEVGWGSVSRNRWSAPSDYEQGLLLKVGGKAVEKGLYAHAASRFEFATNGRWQNFTATAAMRDGAPEFGSVVFIVEGDGVELARSHFLTSGQSEPMSVKIDGVKTLVLRAEGTEGNNHGCWAMWGDPVVERATK